jgi:hypothetical protein
VSGKGPLIPDRRTAQMAGCLMVAGGAYLLWDAYEARGRSRPFWLKLLPG